MKFALISPLRVHSDHWPEITAEISRFFRAPKQLAALPKTWRISDGTETIIRTLQTQKAELDQTDLVERLFALLRSVRRNAVAMMAIPKHSDSVVVVFSTGDAALMRLVSCSDEIDPLATIDNARVDAQKAVNAAIAVMKPFIGDRDPKDVFEADFTATHTVFHCETSDPINTDIPGQAFASEHLTFDPAPDTQFVAGWSYAAVIHPSEDAFLTYVGLMTRLQCTWFATRTNRDYCLRKLRDIDVTAPVYDLLKTEREIVARRTTMRIWQHETREYRANLIPSMTKAADAVEDLWEVDSEQNYIQETLAQARDNIQTSYAARLLIQERRQSLMLSVLTAVNILGIAATLGGVWTWLLQSGLTENAQLQTPTGQLIVIAALVSLAVFAIGFWLIYLIIRNRRE